MSGDSGPCRFQGTIQIVIEASPSKPTAHADDLPETERFTFTALGDAYRWDLFENSVARGDFRIYDRSAHRFYSVMQSQATIFAVPESDKLVVDPAAAYVLDDQHKTGRVAGLPCEIFRVATPTARYEVCATDKLTPFPFHMLPGLVRQVVPFGAELMNRKLYPLLVDQYLTKPDGGAPPPPNPRQKFIKHELPDYFFHAVAVEAKLIDPVVFELPKYPIQRIDLLQAGPKNKR